MITKQKGMIRNFACHEQRAIQLITETLVTTLNTDEWVVVTDRG